MEYVGDVGINHVPFVIYIIIQKGQLAFLMSSGFRHSFLHFPGKNPFVKRVFPATNQTFG
ncbi:hypothetical protein SAMN05444673_6242 [Bacillus sp. OV166]|nr:hypothetical protein SAMN05444673_6242 [Bacillus sp. OV166]